MLLSNVHIIDQAGSKHIHILNGKIERITDTEPGMPTGDPQRLSFRGRSPFPAWSIRTIILISAFARN